MKSKSSLEYEVLAAMHGIECNKELLPIAGEGNVFTHVCLSVHQGVYDVTFSLISCSFQELVFKPILIKTWKVISLHCHFSY